jgi:restriction system protein
MSRVWVVRLGEGGEIVDWCREKGVIAIGWPEVGDLSAFENYEDLRKKVYETYRTSYRSLGSAGVSAGMLWSFVHDISQEDIVLSPKKETRELFVGKVTGPYLYDPNLISRDYPNTRAVDWKGVVPYDNVPREVWRSMTAWQTLFELSTPEAVNASRRLIKDLQAGALPQIETPEEQAARAIEEGQRLFEDTIRRSMEILATHFDKFSGQEFQELVWATLKAAGLYPKPLRRGPDQTIDIEAYRDPLRLGPPRILVQVKHREAQVSGPEMQQFIGAMNREGDVGLFISTSGFTSAARQAAGRSHKPVTLMGWEDFIELFLKVYDRLDNVFKARVPIRSVKILSSESSFDTSAISFE